MTRLTANQQKQLAKKIRTYKDKCFPERGGGKTLAAMLGISPQLLTNWMAGTRRPSMLQMAKLARIFKTSVHELCSIPYAKRKAKASDLVIALTKYHDQAKNKRVNTQKERTRLQAITTLIYNELDGYL